MIISFHFLINVQLAKTTLILKWRDYANFQNRTQGVYLKFIAWILLFTKF